MMVSEELIMFLSVVIVNMFVLYLVMRDMRR